MANDLNFVAMIGRLARDAELKYSQNGLAIGNFSIAVNKSYKQKDGTYKEEVSFFEVNYFGKIAESLQQYLTKGTQVCVKGENKEDRWWQDGQKRSKVKIIAEHIQLLGGKSSHANQGNAQGGYEQPQKVVHVDDFPEDVPF